MLLSLKKIKKTSFLFLIGSLTMFGCGSKSYKECVKNYEEATLPVTVTTNWAKVPSGIQSSVGDINVRYEQHEVPDLMSTTHWNGSAWKGERVSAQIVLWSKENIPNVEFKVSDFRSETGQTFSATNTQVRFVRYVITDEYGNGCGKRQPTDFAQWLSPDVLDNVGCMPIDAETVRPVWVTLDVPSDAEAGHYNMSIELLSEGKKKESFSFSLNVLNETLPPPTEWEFHLDLWQNPYAVARTENTEPWTDEHWKALRPAMQMLADAGQKVITTTLNKRPWNGQTEDPFDSMIEWKKKSDGSWEYDYTIFDNWVEFMMSLGITKQINCYSMVPWGNIFFYFDEESNQEVKVTAAPGTKEYEALWKPFLIDFVMHLKEKGWENKTLVAMDERSPKEMQAMLKLLNETAPTLGVALADDHKSYKLYPDQLVDLCVAQGSVVEEEDRIYRSKKGYVTTWYVCCAQVFPNVFTFSAPAEGAFIGWYTKAAGFDGFLRWAYNSYVKDALIDSRFRTWPAGDTYIVYPEARSSIRFERLKEGIQDAEKIRIVRTKLEMDDSAEGKVKLEELNLMLKEFNVIQDPGNIEELLAKGKKFLNNPIFLNQ